VSGDISDLLFLPASWIISTKKMNRDALTHHQTCMSEGSRPIVDRIQETICMHPGFQALQADDEL
jgi:hypothetical protein